MAFNTHNVVQPHFCRVSRHFHHPKRKPCTQIRAHSPLPTHLLFVLCHHALPCNLMQLITSSSFRHFLHEASRIPTLPGFPYPDLWTLEVQGPVLYVSLSLSPLSPRLTHHGFKFHPCADDPKLFSPARTLRRTPDSQLLLSTRHLSTWPVILVQIKSEPLTSPPSLLFLIYVKSSSRKPYSLYPWHFSFLP